MTVYSDRGDCNHIVTIITVIMYHAQTAKPLISTLKVNTFSNYNNKVFAKECLTYDCCKN